MSKELQELVNEIEVELLRHEELRRRIDNLDSEDAEQMLEWLRDTINELKEKSSWVNVNMLFNLIGLYL